MISFPSHGCYKVDNKRIHPRTLEIETKDNPLPASFYDVDIYFSGVVKYYVTDQPEKGWDWNTGLLFDCIRQLAFHEFAVRSNDCWYLLDVDKRSATVLFISPNALPLTKTTWLLNDLIMPYGHKCSQGFRDILLHAVCPRENTVMSSKFYNDNSVIKLYRPNKGLQLYQCLTGSSQMNVVEIKPGICFPVIVNYDFDRNVVVGTYCTPRHAKSYFITNVGVTLDNVRVSNDDLTNSESRESRESRGVEIMPDAMKQVETSPIVKQRIEELSRCTVS